MLNATEYYQNNLQILELDAKKQRKTLGVLSIARFVVFVLMCLYLYFNYTNTTRVIVVLIIGIGLFVTLVLKHISVKKAVGIVKKKIAINTVELQVLQGHFLDLDTGKAFINKNHAFSNDIDLFGKGSFYQYINRTETAIGKQQLAALITENKTDNILNKQAIIKELAAKADWRQQFAATASLIDVKTDINTCLQWFKNYKKSLPKLGGYLQQLFSLVSLTLIVLVSLSVVPFSVLVVWFFCGLFITGRFLKKTSKLYTDTSSFRLLFKQNYKLLEQIETANFTLDYLKNKQKQTTFNGKKASLIFKKFSKILDALDQRNNLLIALFGNGLFLWELKNALALEQWLLKYKTTVKDWFSVIAFFDAYNTLANFYFNHQDYVFPELNQTTNTISATNLGHPLLNKNVRIDNTFTIDKGQFFIVTGANMAGKSTFLRTVALSIIMANVGLPVCASRFTYMPIQLITSIRTSDSLTENESYFYSELKRLKFIVNTIKTANYFIILDEILKGTNSKDKADGSKKFVEKLTNSKSTGIIATHDVSLCELAEDYNSIENYFFDAKVKENELAFDYKLQKGVCVNRNATFLLEKMEII